jgi:ACS family tartrate transporter-like MFS transporter
MGLAGWQWLFLLEGLPAIVFGFIVWFALPDKPTEARWLAPDESAAITQVIAAEQTAAHENHGVSLRHALTHRTVWQLALIMFACQCGSYGLTLWIPQIVKGLSGFSNFAVAMISSIPYIGAAIGMIWIGISSDRTGERFLHIAVPCFIGAVGFTASALMQSPVPGIIALTIAAIGDLGSRGPFWSLPGRFLASNASAGGIALINTVGAIGGFVGPYAVGVVKDTTGSFAGGLFMLAGLLFVAGLGVLAMRSSPTLTGTRRSVTAS